MILLSILVVFSMSAAQLSPVEVADRVQSVYNEAASMRCDFVQLYRSGTTGKVTEASGELLLKKPGKMRWDYKDPERKLYVSDGETVYWYLPNDRQVTKMSLDEADQQQTQILFLTGRGELNRDFEVSNEMVNQALYDGSYLLRLVPNREEDFDYLVLEINPTDYYVERMIVVDTFGNSTDYRFLNIRPADIADTEFAFTVPRGVEVFEGK